MHTRSFLGGMISKDSPSANSCKAAAEFEASTDGPGVARFRAFAFRTRPQKPFEVLKNRKPPGPHKFVMPAGFCFELDVLVCVSRTE